MTLFKHHLRAYGDVVLKQDKNNYPQQLMAHLFHDVLQAKTGLVVDIGCGRGDQLIALNKLGFETLGVDREQGESVDYVCDFTHEAIPIASNSVDYVFSKSVIEHLYLPEIKTYMQEIWRILKPGGSVCIVTPDWLYCAYDFYDGFTHVTPFTPRSLSHCLQIYGFSAVNTYSLIQLPLVWRWKSFKFLADVTQLMPCPRRYWNKWIRWSKERQVVAWGQKIVT